MEHSFAFQIEEWKGRGQTPFTLDALSYLQNGLESSNIKSHQEFCSLLSKINQEVPEFQMWLNISDIVEDVSLKTNFKNQAILSLIRVLKEHILSADKNIAKEFMVLVTKLKKEKIGILTHCHSSVVINALIKVAKHLSKKIEIYVTESRPKLNGNKTALELSSHNINTIFTVDVAIGYIMNNIDLVVLGADAIDKEGNVLNRVGSLPICCTAKIYNVPVYVLSQVVKYKKNALQADKIRLHDVKSITSINMEIGKIKSKYNALKFLNPYFDIIPYTLVTNVLCEYGVISSSDLSELYKKMVQEITCRANK